MDVPQPPGALQPGATRGRPLSMGRLAAYCAVGTVTVIGMVAAFILLLFVGILLITSQREPAPFVATPFDEDAARPAVTKSEEYTVLKDVDDHAKQVLHVALARKPSVDELRSICARIKTARNIGRPRTVIWTSLLGQRNPQECWALADFDPDLRLEIRGFTIEEEKALLDLGPPTCDELIGAWLADKYMGGRYTIYRQAGRVLCARADKEGQHRPVELIEIVDGRQFRPVGMAAGKYYRIALDGTLELGDGNVILDRCLPVVRAARTACG